jgi:hypothetical protein
MNEVYAALILILVVCIPASAQDEMAPLSDEDDLDYYLLREIGFPGELWELDSDLFLEETWVEQTAWCDICDILLWLFLELEVTDEETEEIFPDLWELDYEFYPLWEEEWNIDSDE